MKHPIRYRAEYWLARLLWTLFAALPVATASNFGAGLAVVLGRLPPLRRRADRNLRLAMPELDQHKRAAIISGVWQNLGRTLAELPHLENFTLTEGAPGQGEIQVVGAEKFIEQQDQVRGCLFFGGHLANWELMYLVAAKLDRPVHVVYRAANNPLIDGWLSQVRKGVSLSALAKGRTAARGILTALKQGDAVGMLVDQKMNDGIAVPFFGRPAMTAPALAELALRQDLAITPMRCERLAGAAFRVTFLDPLSHSETGDHAADVMALMSLVNNMLEDWIRARPEQWLWLHNRWPS